MYSLSFTESLISMRDNRNTINKDAVIVRVSVVVLKL